MSDNRRSEVRYRELGRWLRKRRQELQLTQVAVAAQCQVGPSCLSNLERGQMRASTYVAPRLAKILGVDEDEIHLRGGRVPDHFLKDIVRDPERALVLLRQLSGQAEDPLRE